MSNLVSNEDAPNPADLTLPHFNAETARAVLEWLRQGFPQEQETFERLTQSLDKTQAATNGFTIVSETPATSPIPNGSDECRPSFIIPPNYPQGAIAALDLLLQGDAEEQREIFESLKKGLNEDRAAGGERLLFPDDDE